jgi:hypothetical protein
MGDSLAANAFGGFKEGFFAVVRRCCRACNCTRAEMVDSAEVRNLRSAEEHSRRVAKVSNPYLTRTAHDYWSKEYGVNGGSVLLDFPHFSVTDSLLFDPMHDITEGLFPLHLELLLKVHTKEIPRYSLERFNDFLTHETPVPASDKPNPIGDKLDVAGKQSSFQMLSIMCALPFFYLRIEAAHDEHWVCMLLLIHITQLTFSPVSTQGLISD